MLANVCLKFLIFTSLLLKVFNQTDWNFVLYWASNVSFLVYLTNIIHWSISSRGFKPNARNLRSYELHVSIFIMNVDTIMTSHHKKLSIKIYKKYAVNVWFLRHNCMWNAIKFMRILLYSAGIGFILLGNRSRADGRLRILDAVSILTARSEFLLRYLIFIRLGSTNGRKIATN